MSMPAQRVNQMMAAQAQQQEGYKTLYYDYSLQFLNVANASTSSQQLTIQADSDFLIQMLTYVLADPNATPPANVFPVGATIQLTDTGSGMNLFDQPQPLQNIFGTAQLPFILPTPRLMQKNASLTGTLYTGYLAHNSNFYFTFHGQRIYNLNGP